MLHEEPICSAPRVAAVCRLRALPCPTTMHGAVHSSLLCLSSQGTQSLWLVCSSTVNKNVGPRGSRCTQRQCRSISRQAINVSSVTLSRSHISPSAAFSTIYIQLYRNAPILTVFTSHIDSCNQFPSADMGLPEAVAHAREAKTLYQPRTK